jgi:hypothetical protein
MVLQRRPELQHRDFPSGGSAAFDDLFWFIGWITLAILPLPFIVKMSRTKAIVIA